MSVQVLDPVTIRRIGLDALAKALGPIGMVRFLQQFESGTGNYAKEREQWLNNMDVESIVAEIKHRRKKA